MRELQIRRQGGFTSFSALPDRYKELLLSAKEAIENGYNPYTKTKVGAAILAANGKVVSAANVTNKAKWNSICAERAAIVKANSEGMRRFIAIAVIGRKKHDGQTQKRYIFTPCGPCRQFIYEFTKPSRRDIDVIMSDMRMNNILVMKISELLPMAYD